MMRWAVAFFSFVTIFSPVRTATAQITTDERAGLLSLYSATNGAGWTNNGGWSTAVLNTECDWYGVTCVDGHVARLILTNNALSGYIPSDVGKLTYLVELDLDYNNLSGNIPTAIGSLVTLEELYLGFNHLDGSIPTQLGNLTNLTQLYLDWNHLSGPIPSQLGNLVLLQNLVLGASMLSGSIPFDLVNLVNLLAVVDTDFGYNALHTDDVVLKAFLDSKDPDWDETQTIAPAFITVGSQTSSSVVVRWTPIMFTDYDGWYSIIVTEAALIFADGFESGDTTGWTSPSQAPFVEFTTVDKTDNSILVDGLQPGTQYQFVVRTISEPNDYNDNQVVSEYSAPVLAWTLP